MGTDPVISNPDLYTILFENDRVRVLEYRDRPGDRTKPHSHPDSVMVTLSAFRRRLSTDGREIEVELPADQARWLDAQEHSGENIGETETHAFFVELNEEERTGSTPAASTAGRLGPQAD